MRESPAWIRSHSRDGLMMKAADGAVRLFFGGDRGQLDHQVRFEHELLQCLGGVVLVGREAVEQLLGRQDDLVGRLAAAALAAHAVRQHGQRAARDARVHDDLDLILLVGAVAAMHAGRRCEAIPWWGCAHDRKL